MEAQNLMVNNITRLITRYIPEKMYRKLWIINNAYNTKFPFPS
jgi:hypothetical protein